MIVVAVLAGTLALAAVVGWLTGELKDPNRPRSEQIMDGCRREFGDRGEEAVNDCALKITIRELEQSERDKLERAAR